jgi:hypothetical protein
MNDVVKSALVAATMLTGSTAYAGGPVIIEEGNGEELVADKPGSSIGILPVLGALVLICLVACGGGDDDAGTTPATTIPDPDPK